MNIGYCKGCYEKQRKIDKLEAEVKRLKEKLRYQERTAKEGYFGSSTPSSKKPIKENASEEEKKKKGGGIKGHKGYGRKKIKEEEADMTREVKVEKECPYCGIKLKDKGKKKRIVIDCETVKVKRIIYYLENKECSKCGRKFNGKVEGVLPRSLYTNRFLTYVAIEHYIRGIPLGRLAEQLKVGYGSLICGLHRIAKIFERVPEELIKEYRESEVKHADETGWRNDGENGYAWLFANEKISIYKFSKSRGAAIPKEIFGTNGVKGVLVVDRYNGYNKVPCKIQYCYAHLLREVEDLAKEFPDNSEIKRFVESFAPLLSEAIRLRGEKISKSKFKRRANKIKREIIKIVNCKAKHPGIQRIQNIFRNNEQRLYHWAKSRDIPADNNFAERELRHLVISRKLSFGSQSDNGAKTREILMTVLHTLRKQTDNLYERLENALNIFAVNPTINLFSILFPSNT